MLISRKWLQQYIDISNDTIEELADKITSAGLEVEGIQKQAIASNLIIGKVISCIPHPDSDHLHITEVDIKEDVLTIVCGAANIAVNQKVIVALEGAKLKNITIKKGNIRGQKSEGMICSLLELSIDPKLLTEEQKQGIEVLSDDAEVGNRNVLEYLGYDDEILDISLTPNRNDCMSAFAMAYELGAILGKEVQIPKIQKYHEKDATWKIKVETEKCDYYCGQLIESIQIKESPRWIKELLRASNIKPINNVVDIANLVMLETGQPLHFYDANTLSGKTITISDQKNEEFHALNENMYHIKPCDITIWDDSKMIALAGIIGSNETKVTNETTSIFCESAHFTSEAIRNTARNCNIVTDASVRFQKGINIKSVQLALFRAISLLKEYANASGIEDIVENKALHYSEHKLIVNIDRINDLLGTCFEKEQMIDVLSRLRFQPVLKQRDIELTIPYYRMDIQLEADIAEEIIRLIGFDGLKSTMLTLPTTVGVLNERQKLRRTIKNYFTQQGFYETLTYTLVSKAESEQGVLALQNPVDLQSAMSEKRSTLRTSLLNSLLECTVYNNARSNKDFSLFEISNVYEKQTMQERLAVVMQGVLHQSKWQKLKINTDFYTLKGLIYRLLEDLGIHSSRIKIEENGQDNKYFHPYQSVKIYIGKELFGIFGKIHPSLQKKLDIDDLVMGEFILDVLLKQKKSKVKFEKLSKFPSVQQDFAFVVKKEVKIASIIEIIKKLGKIDREQIIQHVEVFDIYTGEHVEEGYKSVALSIEFQSMTHTLDESQIQHLRETILTTLNQQLNIELRS